MPSKNKNHEQLIKAASYASVSFAAVILVAKIYGYSATSSQSMLASLVDSLLDISSSIINFFAIRVALLPPDDNHRFGHNKFEDLAIFSQSTFFFLSGIFTLGAAAKALFFREVLEQAQLGTVVMFLCLFLTLLLVVFQSYVVRQTKSSIIAADKLHYFTDFLTNLAVILSLYLSQYFWYIDHLAGIAIASYIIYASWQLFRVAIRNLVDEEFSKEERLQILSIIKENFPEIQGVHELKTRYASNKPFIQLHIEMAGEMSLYQAHDIAERLVDKLLEKFPGGEVTVHQDPIGVEEDVNYREELNSV